MNSARKPAQIDRSHRPSRLPVRPSLLLKPLFRNWYPDWLVNGEEDPLRA